MLSNIKSTNKCRYRLTYPIHSSKIYESGSFETVVKQCYNDFKELTDIPEGKFIISDLTNKKKFTFQVNKKKLMQMGGYSKYIDEKKDVYKNDLNMNLISENKMNDSNKHTITENEIVQLKDTITNMNDKIKSLENKLNNIDNSDSDNIYNVILSDFDSKPVIKDEKDTNEDDNGYCAIQ